MLTKEWADRNSGYSLTRLFGEKLSGDSMCLCPDIVIVYFLQNCCDVQSSLTAMNLVGPSSKYFKDKEHFELQ